MPDCILTVTHCGPLVTLQDRGRPGHMRFGVPASGPMDRNALAIANAALGNPPDACAVEVSLGGLHLTCAGAPVTFALAGGGFRPEINGIPRAHWTVASLQPGDHLAIRPGPWGSWAMLAVAGQIQSRTWLNSAATHAQSGLGGGILRPGMTLTIANPLHRPALDRDLSVPDWAGPTQDIRVVAGPQDRFFAPETLTLFQSSPFTLSAAYDRMGVRLTGPRLAISTALDMPSEPVLRGSVQVAGDGIATVLLADHQTTGGYPKIATVIAPDLDRLIQCRSGDTVRFTAITPAEAISAARAHASALATYLATPATTLHQRLTTQNLISGVVDASDP